jgi:acyl-CoA synthetase (AMP-forming)/AMP-acid ligase II
MTLTPVYPTLGEALADQAARKGGEIAFVFGDRRTTFAELDQRATQLARALISSGCGPGAIAAVLGKNSDRYGEVIFGAARAGAITLAMNWRLARPELEYIANDTKPRILFFDNAFEDEARHLGDLDPDLLLVNLDEKIPGVLDYEGFLQRADPARELPKVDPREPTVLLYTSGTTGLPKGVLTSQYGLLFNLTQSLHTDPPTSPRADDVVLLSPPLFHSGGLCILVSAIMYGSRTIVLREAKVPDMLAAIEVHKVTRAVIIPALMPQIIEAASAGADLQSLKTVCYGMSPIAESVLVDMVRLLSCKFVQQYGMTEVSGSATNLGPDDHYVGSPHLTSCGRALPDTEMMVRGENGGPAPPGQPGEVLLKTPSHSVGFWRERRRTAPDLASGWYETGDIGYLDEQGYLFLCDRKKDMIITGGENVYSAEVESVLARHPAIDRVAVIGVPSEKWGEEVKAVVLPRPGANPDPREIMAFARDHLAGYKAPKSVDFVSELPLTSVGKIAKNVLREQYWRGQTRRIN